MDGSKKYLGKRPAVRLPRQESEKKNIQRINAATRLEGMSYSQFMGLLKKNDIEINRKVLADLAMNQPEAFKAIVNKVK